MPDSPASADPLRLRFVAAVEAGDAAALGALLASEPGAAALIEKPLFSFDRPAIVAARDDRALVDLLLAHGANLDARSRWWAGGFGVLDGASPEVAAFLIERGATVDAHAAAALGKLDRLEELVRADPAVVHAKGGDGMCPLHGACTVEVVDWLVAHGAEVDARCVDHESTAAQYKVNDEPLCRRLLEHGAHADLFLACALGEPALARAELERFPAAIEARIDCEGYPVVPAAPGGPIYNWELGFNASPHQVAHRRGHGQVYALLLERSSPARLLVAACERGDVDEARRRAEADPGLARRLPHRHARLLADAAWERDLPTVRAALAAGFDPHVCASEDSTPLDRAAFHGFADVIELLLAHDPAPPLTHRNAYGGTPLEAALYGALHTWRQDGDHPATVELLLQAGSPLDPQAWQPTGIEPVDAVVRRWLG